MPTPSSSKRVIFVHGFAGSASTPGFSTLLGDSTIDDYVEAFHYYQDSPTCDVPLPVIEPLSGMPVDEGSIGTSTCDSEGDVGLNALALDEAISTLYAENGGHKVILVGFSMGAAIIRGFLDYSTGVNGGTGDGVAANMVDSVMFIAGAHDGSWLLLGANAIDALGAPFGLDGAVDHYLLEPLFNDVGFSYDRPATTELSPLSSWYEWANSDDRPLPSNIGYYNAFGSITFHEHHCYLVVAACQDVSLFGIGDGVLLTGTNDPYDTAWEGGAKFSRPDTVEQWEFEYDRNVVVELNHVLSNPIDAMKDFVNDVANAPELHTNLGAHTHDVIVRSCTTNANVRLDDQYLDIIRGKLNLEVYACPTH